MKINKIFFAVGIFLMIIGLILIIIIETGTFGLSSVAIGGLLFIISMRTKQTNN